MLPIKSLLASSETDGSLGKKFREERFRFFEKLVEEKFPENQKIRVLDVGGTQAYWEGKSILKKRNLEITVLNLIEFPVNLPNFRALAGDATHMPEFGDNSFDLVFSNSVIEHLYSWENQVKMAKEISRVGKSYFVQTPNRNFVIEPHYALPLFQFVPKGLAFNILTKTKLSRFNRWEPSMARQYLDEIRLLSIQEMKTLFPDGEVYLEKFLGMNKSVTMFRF
ncbi:class I SAM-dependent methyltransferase [Litoribacter alkaliphilus]|uniref:Class I SAM-dependent methyltransferase n=1 Tax=Litoribacter ruber TaxID=702568 RepID=A0AAP2CGW3_9BACT|nr:class I SAM-dependent methyltransferase [Litoribacter alkaliphilus]MBS9523464.1 class I SAM-dependent methyltransferase [Litoribacter alkaliphilus]